NASEAIGEKRGRVLLKTFEELQPSLQHGEVCSNPLPPVPCFVLEINDSGCGILPEALEHVFDPFFTTKAPGRGLGLASVLGIVRGHKGAVALRSELEQGTSLRLFFPQATSTMPARPISTDPELMAPVGSAYILVVDDETTVLHTTKAILEMQGFSVLTAASGEEGMEIFQAHQRDIALALIDLAMPGMNGKEMLETLYVQQASLPVIIMSGFPASEALRGFTAHRPALFLQKPYSAHILIESVIKALRARG
ncbi:TPA: hypothetical protein DDW35_11465, partial [Candidatus Sumerlaeota bacterium]|nr:hypothetical protein [Candidatus Sumerlaeota bacterium]